MSADTFIQDLTQVLFVLIFLVVAARTAAQPRRANVDTSLLFGAVALIVVVGWITNALGVKSNAFLAAITQILLMALPYLLLRLVDDFAGVSRRLMAAAIAGLSISVLLLLIWHAAHLPSLITLLLVVYFVALSVYDAVAFVRSARHSSGITRRRMRAVALGSLCLGLVIVVAGVESLFPASTRWLSGVIANCLGLACGISYFVGFTPPRWLRRTWQEPELRAFLGRAASLPRLPDTAAIVRELEHGTATSLGTGRAAIGVWNESAGELEFYGASNASQQPLVDSIARQAFADQHPVFSADARRDNPADYALYRSHNVNSVLAVPITAGSARLGVLTVYAVRAPIFAEDDLTLAQLLADQAAVILESRALIDEAARVRAREEATRLKDDFLSAAAHDLKTPLTALIAQAQLMERRARRDPAAPADLTGIQRMAHDSQRLRRLVTDLLDVGRVEQGKLVDKREEIDFVPLVREVCERYVSPRYRCRLEAHEAVIGSYDPVRIAQLVDNLIDNAVKYMPEGGEVRVTVWRDQDLARITVADEGIGIPADDLPRLFDRFHRGANVDDRRFAGMGLGLFICRGIAEQHGGQLWATSAGLNQGSTFHVVLPASPSPGSGEGRSLVAPLSSAAEDPA